ncbi:hypothetical protein Tco_1485898 [Tanacetum coccineum]
MEDERGELKYFHLGELVKKFFKKFYPLSCTSNYDKMYDDDEEGRDPLEFIPWTNSKFKDPKKVDEMTKRALLYTWTEIRKEEGLLNDKVQVMKNRRSKNMGTLLKTHSLNPILKWIKQP